MTPARTTEPGALDLVTPEMLAAAWDEVRDRYPNGRVLGPGPGFAEAIAAALAKSTVLGDRDRLAAQVEAMRAERDRWRDVLWSVCGHLELPRSEPSGPADDPVLYERVIDGLEDAYRQAERERVAFEARMHSAEAALVRFAEIAKGIPFHVADAAPVARITQDAKHPGTITTLTAADFRRVEKVLDTARSALGLPEPEGESRSEIAQTEGGRHGG